jgi:predicted DNA-binding transcriptional regulator YafY
LIAFFIFSSFAIGDGGSAGRWLESDRRMCQPYVRFPREALPVTRQARLFAIAEYLRGRRTGVIAQAIADRFGVSVRTVYRDLDALRLADLPLRAEQGRGGGYALDRHYTLPPINLNAREAALLIAVASHATRMRLLPFTETLEGALDKVRGALSASAQRELLAILEKLTYVGVPVLPAPAEVRQAVEEAWFTQTPVRVRYRRADGSSGERIVNVAGVVMERHTTLLECVDVSSGEKRHLRLDRIDHAERIARWDRSPGAP